MSDELSRAASESPEVSRRSLMGASTVVAALLAVTDLLGAMPARAAPVWGHPFIFYSSRSRGFTGQYSDGKHAGIDYTPGVGTPIHAVADGTIIYSASHPTYGETVWLDHGDGFTSRYAHMLDGTRVSAGPFVARGTYLGRVGNTGQSYGAHLHIEVLQGATALDPDPLIDRNQTAPLAGSDPPEDDMQDDERAALFQIRDTLNALRGELVANGNPKSLDLYKIVHAADGGGIWIVGISGKRAQIGTPYHVELLQRLRNDDTLLQAELDICRTYMEQVAV